MRCSFAPGSKAIECDNGAAPSSPSREFIYGNGELLATVSGGATTYYQSDHLSVRMTTDSSGNILGQQGHFPFGEAWYSSSGNTEWMFTTYQHDQETGLEYALARYYDPRTATFCSADPVEGNPSDPESWNRYIYARDNPINLTDPSGQFWLWHALELIGMIAADVFSGGITQLAFEGISPLAYPDLIATLGMYSETGKMVSDDINQAKQQGRQGQLPPPLRLPHQPQRINCGSWSFNATIVGPLPQAPGNGALSGKPPQVGNVAINPGDFGEGNYYDLASQASTNPANKAGYRAYKKLLGEQADLKNAQIEITPTSKLPEGIPSQGPYSGTDVYDQLHAKPNTVDVYRSSTMKQAKKLGRFPVTGNVSLIPHGNVKCPK